MLAWDRALAPGARIIGQRVGLVSDPANDQPQRLVLPAGRDVGRLGNLGVLKALSRLPRLLTDALQRRPHRTGARHRDREAHLVLAAVVKQINAIEPRIKPGADRPMTAGQVAQRPPQQSARLFAARGVVAGQKLRAQQPAALRPAADQRLVGELSLVVDASARLVAPVDLHAGRVEIQRHLPLRRAAQLSIHRTCAPRKRRLGRA